MQGGLFGGEEGGVVPKRCPGGVTFLAASPIGGWVLAEGGGRGTHGGAVGGSGAVQRSGRMGGGAVRDAAEGSVKAKGVGEVVGV